jgi:hypothetical protein
VIVALATSFVIAKYAEPNARRLLRKFAITKQSDEVIVHRVRQAAI